MTSLLARERRLAAEVDAIVERAIRFHWPPAEIFATVWPPVLQAVGGLCAAASLIDEFGALQRFTSRDETCWPPECAALFEVREATHRVLSDRSFLAYPMDVAGERLGALVVELPRRLDEAEGAARAQLLAAAVEVLDNHLGSLVSARRKQEAAHEMSAALQHPVLEEGVRAALAALGRYVALGDLLLVFRQEGGLRGAPQTYKLLRHRSGDDEGGAERGAELLDGDATELLRALGLSGALVRTVMGGVHDGRPIAKLFVQSVKDRFDSQELDLLRLFTDFLRQRLADFQREWRQLSRSFCPEHTARLLREPDYRARILAPQERQVAVLYADLSGFTRICETVLAQPALIAQLVDRFGDGAVRLVWEEGGVFDKMVGDCIIALFGPPFFEDTPQQACERALRAAVNIRALARGLEHEPDLTQLRGVPTGVATGLNFCPMFVGYFGPDESYTGFSAGMNNTARLQGVATRDQILATSDFVRALEAPQRFEDEESVRVKNVAEPLLYRKLRSGLAP